MALATFPALAGALTTLDGGVVYLGEFSLGLVALGVGVAIIGSIVALRIGVS